MSDAGADTWVLGGGVWRVEQYIMHKNAHVIGHNQQIGNKVHKFTHSAVACLDTGMGNGRLIRVYHAIMNDDTDVTLILEHQSRELGAIVDSVSKKHKLSEELCGMQHYFVPSGELTIPFQL